MQNSHWYAVWFMLVGPDGQLALAVSWWVLSTFAMTDFLCLWVHWCFSELRYHKFSNGCLFTLWEWTIMWSMCSFLTRHIDGLHKFRVGQWPWVDHPIGASFTDMHIFWNMNACWERMQVGCGLECVWLVNRWHLESCRYW